MSYRLRTLLIFLPIAVAVVGGCIYLQLEAIRVARNSAEFKRSKVEAAGHARSK
jgi:hypothetical protein